MWNSQNQATVILDEVATLLRSQLPPVWVLDGPRLVGGTADASEERESSRIAPDVTQAFDYSLEGVVDAWLDLRVGRERARIAVEVKPRFEPRDVERLVRAFARKTRGTGRVAESPRGPDAWLLVSRFLSARSQALLTEAGWCYADVTGNVRIALERPPLFLRLQGLARDPGPEKRPLRSLRGPVAGRLVRALADFRAPYGIRELAKRARTSPAMASRVVAVLERDAVIERESRGPIVRVDWRALLTRWAEEYQFLKSNRVARFLALRGRKPLLDALRKTRLRYALTGADAAEYMRSVATSPLTAIYTPDIPALARELELEPLKTPATVLLAEPYDAVVYDRTWEREGLRLAAPSQVAVDLITSGDREPRIGEAVLDWMSENESAWRA